MAKVVLEHVRKAFAKGTPALADLSLEIADGEFVALVGPSGCGKSTTLNIIAGLEEPTAGRVRIGDTDVTALQPAERDIAMVFQSYALYPHKDVRGNLAFPLEIAKVPKAEIDARVRETAETLELTALLSRRPRELSGGQRQRVALGRALVRKPKVFLFDEPLSNLDAALRMQMRAELKRLHQRLRATFIYVTHDQSEAMTLPDRIAVLRSGELQQLGAPRELYERPKNRFVAEFFGTPRINVLPGAALGLADKEVGVRPEHLELFTHGEPGALEGTVALVELTGAETWVTIEAAGATLVARAPADFAAAEGSTVFARPRAGKVLTWGR